ncbi:MAG: BON domain-containing protein [Myxococcota bacterium]|nr:BON domain-containing protein [Myxococcota bacterium]
MTSDREYGYGHVRGGGWGQRGEGGWEREDRDEWRRRDQGVLVAAGRGSSMQGSLGRGLGSWGESDRGFVGGEHGVRSRYDRDPRDFGPAHGHGERYPVDRMGRRIEEGAMRMDEGAMRMGMRMGQGMHRMGDEMQHASERFGDRMGEGAYRMGDEVQRFGDRIEEGADRFGEGAYRAGADMQRASDELADRMSAGAYRMSAGVQRASDEVAGRMGEGAYRMGETIEETSERIGDRVSEGAQRLARGAERTGERAHRVRDRVMHALDRVRGPFTGRGPKGYRRRDERIREDVCDQIAHQGWIDASDVEVKVEHGEVTLRGTVRDRADKRNLECMLDQIPGVHDVHNELKVGRRETLRLGSGDGGRTRGSAR